MSSQRPPRPHEASSMAFWASNGSVGVAGDAPRLAPKMGVRARIADWPPKRDPGPVPAGGHRGPAGGHQGVQGFKALHRLTRRRSKDVEFHENWTRPLSLAPLRHRSSSEVTLSECDGGDEEPRGGKKGGGGGSVATSGLFREYGSTSSIDVEGISEQSFFEMLNELRAKRPEGRPVTPEPLAEGSFAPGAFKTDSKSVSREEASAQAKEKPRRRCPRGDESIFKKLRSVRGEGEGAKEAEEAPRPAEPGKVWLCQKSFAHYDVQSLLFDLNAVAAGRALAAQQRRNTTTGASAASVASSRAPGATAEASTGAEDLNVKENLEQDLGDDTSNELLLSCPHFRNEIGGARERNLSFSRASLVAPAVATAEGTRWEGLLGARPTNASVSVLEVPQELLRNPERLRQHSVEHVDLGARYYREHFLGKEHSNYFGVDEKLGPVAVSIKREKLEDHKEHGPQFQYRIIFRTSELTTLRGSILEDATPTATKPGSVRGLPLRDALEYVVPELNIHCLRLALSTAKVTEQLLKLDEQGLCRRHKVGILYCKAGQSSEEEMYNNEEAGPAFEEFLELLGEKVCLRAFSKYAAQLDTKTDSTGTHSLYTTYQDYEIMFHVSTMLPYTPNNRQQLLRKRHIGNDIVTIVFQEPGALPFTPQSVRSHFQHVFIIVRAHNPCSERVSYSVAVTRSKDVPPFGPPVPGAPFGKTDAFRSFLLAKALNGENAAHKSFKFHAMATRTRREYLKDLAENYVTTTPLDSSGKFHLISLASKKKEKTKARAGAERLSGGAIAWRVSAQDFAAGGGGGGSVPCVLAVSKALVVLVDPEAKEVVFNCFCGDVVGWSGEGGGLKVFYGRGDHVMVRAADEDLKEIVQRLKVVTGGCEAVEMTLRRNGLGQLGFHVQPDGTVAEVEEYGFAWQAGLRQGSRLLEICKAAVVSLSHEQMIDLLRTSVTVKVLIVPPHDDGTPRRGWWESLELSPAEPKVEPEPLGYRPPFRSSPGWQWSGPASHNPLPGHGRHAKGNAGTSRGDPQGLHGKRPVSFPESPHPPSVSVALTERPQPHRQPSGSFSAPGSAGTTFHRYKPSPERLVSGPDGLSSGDSSSGGLSSHEGTMERHRPEPLWHVPAQARLPGGATKRSNRQETTGKDSPNRTSKVEPHYSSHSSSNTLSSNASSDDRWFDVPDTTENEGDSGLRGGSSDSGIDTSSKVPPPPPRSLPPQEKVSRAFGDDGSRLEALAALGKASRHKGGVSSSSPEPFKPPSVTPRLGYSGSEPPRTPQLSASVPKSFFSRQAGRSKQPGGAKRPEETPEPQKPWEAGGRNVFGQPRLRASLRDLRSPRKSHKSTFEDDLKKLLLMDNAAPEPETPGLPRTLSDESLCGGRREAAALGAAPASLDTDVLLASPFPCGTLPGRRQTPQNLPERKAAISASELALDKPALRRMEPGLMPLPDTASGLEWASLVNAAKAYEVQRAVSLFSLAEPSPSPEAPEIPPRGGTPQSQTPPVDLPEKVSQLEAMLRQLHSDLQKEKQDKVVLQAEVANLRQNNRRLQEESNSAARQLRRFARIFSGAAGDKEDL